MDMTGSEIERLLDNINDIAVSLRHLSNATWTGVNGTVYLNIASAGETLPVRIDKCVPIKFEGKPTEENK
jgi:hypothetical protein